MKNPNSPATSPFRSRHLTLSAFAAAVCLGLPLQAQDFIQDTLAVRILLDQNGLTETPVTQVITTESQRVTQLRLGGLNLIKLPSEIGVLTALKYLVLSGNLLDSLPAELWDLSALVELDLGGNRLSGLDAGVGRLSNLLLLGLRGNGLKALPAGLYSLPQLEALLLAGNDLDSLPEAIAELPFLRYLDLSGNQLKTVPFTVAAMERLDSLDLSGNLMESLPDLITEMKAATKVRITDNRLCSMTPAQRAWADGKDPGWFASQICGSPVRQGIARATEPGLRVFVRGDAVRFECSGLRASTGPAEIRVRNASGQTIRRFSIPIANGSPGVTVPLAGPGGHGFLLAELRIAARTVAVAALLP
ncbi:MAG: leucine-rich repeat domain-containing protein [Fibrobacteria bacterium]